MTPIGPRWWGLSLAILTLAAAAFAQAPDPNRVWSVQLLSGGTARSVNLRFANAQLEVSESATPISIPVASIQDVSVSTERAARSAYCCVANSVVVLPVPSPARVRHDYLQILWASGGAAQTTLLETTAAERAGITAWMTEVTSKPVRDLDTLRQQLAEELRQAKGFPVDLDRDIQMQSMKLPAGPYRAVPLDVDGGTDVFFFKGAATEQNFAAMLTMLPEEKKNNVDGIILYGREDDKNTINKILLADRTLWVRR